jgi:hypothetical protein
VNWKRAALIILIALGVVAVGILVVQIMAILDWQPCIACPSR